MLPSSNSTVTPSLKPTGSWCPSSGNGSPAVRETSHTPIEPTIRASPAPTRGLDGRCQRSSAPSSSWSAATTMNPANRTGTSVWSPAAEMCTTPAPIDRMAAISATRRTALRLFPCADTAPLTRSRLAQGSVTCASPAPGQAGASPFVVGAGAFAEPRRMTGGATARSAAITQYGRGT